MQLVTIRIPDEIKEKLDEIAAKEQRPLSNLVRLIITQWLKEQGEGWGFLFLRLNEQNRNYPKWMRIIP